MHPASRPRFSSNYSSYGWLLFSSSRFFLVPSSTTLQLIIHLCSSPPSVFLLTIFLSLLILSQCCFLNFPNPIYFCSAFQTFFSREVATSAWPFSVFFLRCVETDLKSLLRDQQVFVFVLTAPPTLSRREKGVPFSLIPEGQCYNTSAPSPFYASLFTQGFFFSITPPFFFYPLRLLR